MAASFLQYCAMCEKQITTPSNAILYCSQACRRKDDAKPLSASILPPAELSRPDHAGSGSRSSSPTPPAAGPHSSPTPTASPTPTIRIPAGQHAHKADLDPTEWKPKLRRPGLGRAAHMRHSEAYRYLAAFHSRVTHSDSHMDEMEDGATKSAHQYSSSMYNIPTLMPSLSNTPTTTASSFDGSWEYGYDFNTRPLQARSNPMYAVGAGVNVEELVTPFVPPEPLAHTGDTGFASDTGAAAVAEDLWGKKVVVKSGGIGPKGEGLGRLLGGRHV